MTIEFKNITHSYNDNVVLDALNIEAKSGEITCLFGDSGCGKSTLLRIAAGIERLQSGAILLNGDVLVDSAVQPPPEARPVGIMFQENALFPHMSIAENIAFGLSKNQKKDSKATIERWLENIGLPGYGDRYPHTLSGGQIQRVALARSLAPNPQVLLMDEPYASIDNVLRRHLRESARTLIRQTGATAIFVTHDPVEALEMADMICVMEGGKISQSSSPEMLYKQPQTAKVATLFGDAMTVSAQHTEGGFKTEYGFIASNDKNASYQNLLSQTFSEDKTLQLVVRPEGLHIRKDSKATCKIVDLRFNGNKWIVYVLPQSMPSDLPPLRVAVRNTDEFQIGDGVVVESREADFFVFAESREA